MLTSTLVSLAAHACLGEWAYLPADLNQEVGFQLSLASSNAFSLRLTDYGSATGPGVRQADGSVLLRDGEEVFTLRACDGDSAELVFPDGRVFTLSPLTEDFWELARRRGWEPENDVIETPEWRMRRVGNWIITLEETDSVRRCEMSLRGPQDVQVMLIANETIYYSVSMSAKISEPMSNLRAQGFEPDLIGTFVFDGDVGMRATGQRIGRTGILSPGGSLNRASGEQFLRYLSAASQVSLSFDREHIARVNLSGSAAGVAALRECATYL